MQTAAFDSTLPRREARRLGRHRSVMATATVATGPCVARHEAVVGDDVATSPHPVHLGLVRLVVIDAVVTTPAQREARVATRWSHLRAAHPAAERVSAGQAELRLIRRRRRKRLLLLRLVRCLVVIWRLLVRLLVVRGWRRWRRWRWLAVRRRRLAAVVTDEVGE